MMRRFKQIFNNNFNIIGMIHLEALPGTPKYNGKFHQVIEKAKYEANIFKKYNLDAIIVENMHDIPYVQDYKIGPEIVSSMTRICEEIKRVLIKTPCGEQILACGNKHACAVAKICNLEFIRVEGFIFGHIADEGFTNASAGDLLRYRKQIFAEEILIFTDIKKKHSSHALTADIDLLGTAKAAEFFLSDGVVITGAATGDPASIEDLRSLEGQLKIPIIIGSGVTVHNIQNYYQNADAVIIGSYFKQEGYWENEICEDRIKKLMSKVNEMRYK